MERRGFTVGVVDRLEERRGVWHLDGRQRGYLGEVDLLVVASRHVEGTTSVSTQSKGGERADRNLRLSESQTRALSNAVSVNLDEMNSERNARDSDGVDEDGDQNRRLQLLSN